MTEPSIRQERWYRGIPAQMRSGRTFDEACKAHGMPIPTIVSLRERDPEFNAECVGAVTAGSANRIERVLTQALNVAETAFDPKDRLSALRIAADMARWQAEKLPTPYADKGDTQAEMLATFAATIAALAAPLGVDLSSQLRDYLPKTIEGVAERVEPPTIETTAPEEEIDW